MHQCSVYINFVIMPGAFEKYQAEWKSLFCNKDYIKQLKSDAIKGNLRKSNFRSICWKVLLDCLPEDHKKWNDTMKQQRNHYDKNFDKFSVNPRKDEKDMDISVNHPLSQFQESPWHQYFENKELKSQIKKDILRTFPDIEFFRDPEVQKKMKHVLFLYAREYPHVSYRQGMHELLAPIMFVLHFDHQAYLQVSMICDIEMEIRLALNQNCIEHDAFFLFTKLMECVEPWYTVTDYSDLRIDTAVHVTPISSLACKLSNISKNLLKQHDAQLFAHLEEMEISPQFYGIRWLRLLFGREFPLHDLLVVWDAIFADNKPFGLVDYIFVAMLITVRDLLLGSDYALCLRHLLHFPSISDVQYVIDLALHLRDSGMPKPETCFVQVKDTCHFKTLKESKPAIKANFSKFSNQSKNVVNSDSSTKTEDSRPNVLKIDSSLKDNSEWTKKSDIPCYLNQDNKKVSNAISNQGTFDTYPIDFIHEFMKSKNSRHTEKRSESTEKWICKEMVQFQGKQDIVQLQGEILELKLMNRYCVKEITNHIDYLQAIILKKRSFHEDEMCISLAHLKKARDILGGIVRFSEVSDIGSNETEQRDDMTIGKDSSDIGYVNLACEAVAEDDLNIDNDASQLNTSHKKSVHCCSNLNSEVISTVKTQNIPLRPENLGIYFV